MPDASLKGNRACNRAHYYCFEDNDMGIYRMIPLSGRIDQFRKIIEKKERSGKPCDILQKNHKWFSDDLVVLAVLVYAFFKFSMGMVTVLLTGEFVGN